MSETQTFTAVPVRINGPTQGPVVAAWWNILRSAGKRLEEIMGSGATPETQQSITNNTSSQNITGLIFSSATYVGFKALLSCYSNNGTNERRHIVELTGWFNSKRGQWDMSVDENGADCTSGACTADPSGFTFTIHATTGQVIVDADNMSGSPTRKIRHTIMKTFAVET